MLLSELAVRTQATLDGDGDVAVERVASLESAGPGTIAFLSNPKYRSQLDNTRATAVIVAPEMAAHTPLPKLVSPNPYATYARVATILHPQPPLDPGVHPTAVVGEGACIAASAAIGAYAVIGAGVTIAERAHVGALCAIGAGASIGADARLHPRVTVYPRCVIGPRTIIHSGAVIGADGFGMAEDGGRWVKIPQVGRVTVGADVEIGANTTIDRGAIDDTVIEDDVKLDNQIQIGHNCRIGAHTAIAGCTGISGSVLIGRNCKIGGAAMISGHLSIADGTVISGAASVYKSIAKAGHYTGVFPTLPFGEWRHVASQLRRLRRLVERVRTLEQRVGGSDGTGTSAPDDGEIER
jgi:UDP-3-O-[3-hydroxymyristoyl] glucosamine N-acyltransferase